MSVCSALDVLRSGGTSVQITEMCMFDTLLNYNFHSGRWCRDVKVKIRPSYHSRHANFPLHDDVWLWSEFEACALRPQTWSFFAHHSELIDEHFSWRCCCFRWTFRMTRLCVHGSKRGRMKKAKKVFHYCFAISIHGPWITFTSALKVGLML